LKFRFLNFQALFKKIKKANPALEVSESLHIDQVAYRVGEDRSFSEGKSC